MRAKNPDFREYTPMAFVINASQHSFDTQFFCHASMTTSSSHSLNKVSMVQTFYLFIYRERMYPADIDYVY